MSVKKEKIGIVGSGLIGRFWAMLFAGAGYQVFIYDIEPKQVDSALSDIKIQLKSFEEQNILRGKLNAEQQYKHIRGVTKLSDAVKGAVLVQECVSENLDLKKKVWQGVDEISGPNTIFSSSTSTFVPSLFTVHLKHRKNAIVSHPVNPPYYVRLVEIVPAPWTDPAVAKKTREIMEEIGQVPVSLSQEVPGFALNRIQYAILNECWNLVYDGILNVSDIDKVMKDGLAWNYAFMGPLETAHLNAEGWLDYCKKYTETIYSVSVTSTFKPIPKFEGLYSFEVAKQLEEMVPLYKLSARRKWRDICVEKLAALRNSLTKKK